MRAKSGKPAWAGKWISALFWLCLWALCYRAVGQDLLLASPLQVAGRLLRLAGTAAFWQTVFLSLLRTVLAYALGVAAAAALAAACSASKLLRDLLNPALAVIRATPVTSFIILALVWLRPGNVPVLTGFLMVLPIVYANLMEGIAGTDRELLEMGRMYHFGVRKTLLHIYIPSVLPAFVAACEASIGLCWKATVAAEVLGVPRGAIGTQLYNAKIYLETDSLLAWTAVVIAVSMALEKLFIAAMRTWRRKSAGAIEEGMGHAGAV